MIRAVLNVCFPYTSRDDIATAASKSASLCVASSSSSSDEKTDNTHQECILPSDITIEFLESQMYLADTPPLDIFIRTSGVERLSDFLVWQIHGKKQHVATKPEIPNDKNNTTSNNDNIHSITNTNNDTNTKNTNTNNINNTHNISNDEFKQFNTETLIEFTPILWPEFSVWDLFWIIIKWGYLGRGKLDSTYFNGSQGFEKEK